MRGGGVKEERDLERIDRESFECGRRNSIGNSVRDGIPFNGYQRLLPCPLVTIDSNTSDQLLTDRGVSCLSLAGQFVRCCCADVCACEFRCCRQAADSHTYTHSHWEWGNTNTVSERAISQRIHTHTECDSLCDFGKMFFVCVFPARRNDVLFFT